MDEQARKRIIEITESNGFRLQSPEARKAHAAHLAFLVSRSERERQARQPSVGWDPYPDGDG